MERMKIGGEFRADQWPALRKRLESGDTAAWQEAVTILRKRLGGRYLDQARHLLGRQYGGFAVLAIDCAVLEALEQFRRGEPETPWRQSPEFFRTFLTTTRFKSFFLGDAPKLFYDTLRCGILHQAEAKADSLVKKQHASFVVRKSPSGKGLIINARRFHEEMEGALDDYTAALLHGDAELRACFIKKMNHIARTQPRVGRVV